LVATPISDILDTTKEVRTLQQVVIQHDAVLTKLTGLVLALNERVETARRARRDE